ALGAKYAETVGETTPDANFFVSKNVRDTQWGDFGFIINGVQKVTKTSAGDFGQPSETAFWTRIDPNTGPPDPDKPDDGQYQQRNPNAPFNTGVWAVDPAYDITGDGYGINDSFYAPWGSLVSQKTSERTTSSLSLSLQWQPQDDVNLYFRYSRNKTDSISTKASASMVWGRQNSGPLVNGYYDGVAATDVVLYDDYSNKLRDVVTATFSPVALGTDLGDVYLMTSGLMGGATYKNVASNSESLSTSDSFTLGGDWQIGEKLFIQASVGYSQSLDNRNGVQTTITTNTDEKYDMVHYDMRGVDLMNLTYFQSPWSNYDITGEPDIVKVDNLKAVNPSHLDFDRLLYNRISRNARDTDNSGLSAKIDFDYELLDNDFFTQIKWGVKVDRRYYDTLNYQDKNTGKDATNADGFMTKFKVSDVYVNPIHDPNPGSASHLRSEEWLPCVSDVSIDLNSLSGQVPTQFLSSNCDQSFFTDTLNLLDIRAPIPDSGAPYYAKQGSDIDIEENSTAFYIRTDFLTDVANMPLFGNFGVRYVSTKTDSSGWQKNSTGWQYVPGESSFSQLLPSININLGITDEMFLRVAASTTMSRPKLRDMANARLLNETNAAPLVNSDADGLWQGGPDAGLRYGGDTYADVDGLGIFDEESNAMDINGENLAGQEKRGQAYYFAFDGTGRAGNPALAPVLANSFDISYEWYFSPDSSLSLAYFYKSIDSTIRYAHGGVPIEDDGQLYNVRMRENAAGKDLSGVEFAVQHAFVNLPGLLAHTGVGFNYTFALEASSQEVVTDDEGDEVKREGQSDYSYNLQAYYSHQGFNVRLAYNYRSDFVRRDDSRLGYQSDEYLPELEKARGQLDLSIKYNISRAFRIGIAAVNLNESKTVRYLKHEEMVSYVREPGRSYTAFINYQF
ncbi:MAG: TonB-dependent receptor, partial [Saprospiraceae bacterium]|nr:TonB-dependent receptor [Saprospiraceae bacterium]